MIIAFYPILIALAVPEIFYGSASKGYKVFFKYNSFEEGIIVFKTNSFHLLFRQLKNVLSTYYEYLMGHE